MSEASVPTLEEIIRSPARPWKYRHRTAITVWIIGLPFCAALGLAARAWESREILDAIISLALGLSWIWLSLLLGRRWNRQEMSWRRSELLSRAKAHGYSEAQVIACEERLLNEELALEQHICR